MNKKKRLSHFERRMFQRGFSETLLDMVLQFGEEIYARNSLYYFMSRKALAPLKVPPQLKEKLEGLTVVLDPKTLRPITCFRNPGFRRKIRFK